MNERVWEVWTFSCKHIYELFFLAVAKAVPCCYSITFPIGKTNNRKITFYSTDSADRFCSGIVNVIGARVWFSKLGALGLKVYPSGSSLTWSKVNMKRMC